MKIRGNTVGTTIAPEKVLVKSENLTEEEKAQARENIGAMQAPEDGGTINLKHSDLKDASSIGFTQRNIDGEQTGGVYISCFEDASDETGYIYGVLEFAQADNGHNVILRRLQDGINPDDAATVGQLKAAISDAASVPDQSAYFEIDYDGIVSLKAEYRADGSKNAELPEIIVIPDVIDGTAVSGFVASMFKNNLRVKEITIPDGVTELPDQFCSGAKNLIALHNTEQITKLGQRIVLNTQIRKAMFPNLKEVAIGALAQAMFMHTADIGNNITEIPYGLFRMCPLLSLVKGGGSVKTIGKEAFFYNRNLKNLPFLSQVTSIGDKAFFQSRIQFDWSSIESQCTITSGAVPVMDNTTDYWTGVNHMPCENPLGTMMSQVNPEWASLIFGDSVMTYQHGCAVFAALHIHSALSGKRYNHPDEFAEELRAIDPALVTQKKHPTNFGNVAPMLNALGYNSENGYTVTVVEEDITQESYQALCDALARGAYVYTQASGYNSSGVVTPDFGHAVILYGINSNNEMLVLDSGTLHSAFPEVGVGDIFTYRMPYQNLTGPSSNYIIVEKGE